MIKILSDHGRPCAILWALVCTLAYAEPLIQPPSNVFEMPRIHPIHQQMAGQMRLAMQQRDYEQMERICRDGVTLLPENAVWRYNLACVLARRHKPEEALKTLHHAVRLGFHDADKIAADDDFETLRKTPEFNEILEMARAAPPPEGEDVVLRRPNPVVDGRARVSESNTTWNLDLGHFQSYFTLPEAPFSEHVAVDFGEAGELLNQWFTQGLAAGNHGDYYDNRDGGHSMPDLSRLPQVSRIEYAPEAQSANADKGLSRFVFNGVVVGNSSMAQAGSPFWRSMARIAMQDGNAVTLLFMQYLANHLYIYPAHHDYMPSPRGKGDVFPARVPYLMVTRGSSFSDKPLIEAAFLALAAFQPEVKRDLARHRFLMPTVQMLLRFASTRVQSEDDYRSSRAHPVCFDGNDLDLLAMVRMANAITLETAPPMINLRMLDEQRMQPGKDFFDHRNAEGLFDSPGAIARVMRGMPFRRRYILTAEHTRGPNDLPLRFHWSVLQGDPGKIEIQPLNSSGSRVEIRIAYHERFTVEGNDGQEITSSRVDIGVVAHNGHYFSAPGLVSFYYLDNEERLYSSDQRILSVDYGAARDRYVDPMISLPRNWRDDYLYTPNGRIRGWLRLMPGGVDEYTADGWLVERKDAHGRPSAARSVQYIPRTSSDEADALPELIPAMGNMRATYAYDGDDDLIGRIVDREPIHD